MSTYPDLVRRPAARQPEEVAAELAEARADAYAALAELRRLEEAAPPPLRASLGLGRRLATIGGSADAAPLTRQIAHAARQAAAEQRRWLEEVQAAGDALRQALDADPALQAALQAAQAAQGRADEISTRLRERRAALGALEAAGPADAGAAAAWASEASALRAELEALARLEAEATAATVEPAAAVQAARAAVMGRVEAEAAGALDALRREWAEARAALDADYHGRVAQQERAAAVAACAWAAIL